MPKDDRTTVYLPPPILRWAREAGVNISGTLREQLTAMKNAAEQAGAGDPSGEAAGAGREGD